MKRFVVLLLFELFVSFYVLDAKQSDGSNVYVPNPNNSQLDAALQRIKELEANYESLWNKVSHNITQLYLLCLFPVP